jgi:hypothetical protein
MRVRTPGRRAEKQSTHATRSWMARGPDCVAFEGEYAAIGTGKTADGSQSATQLIICCNE